MHSEAMRRSGAYDSVDAGNQAMVRLAFRGNVGMPDATASWPRSLASRRPATQPRPSPVDVNLHRRCNGSVTRCSSDGILSHEPPSASPTIARDSMPSTHVSRAAIPPVANRLVRCPWHIHRRSNVHQGARRRAALAAQPRYVTPNSNTSVIFDGGYLSFRRVSAINLT